MVKEKEVRLEGAPNWYNKHLDELDFEWSAEEKLEIERYCEKILKNAEEEEMTPVERWKAHMWGKPKDRNLICICSLPTYTTRVLDSFADAIKPIDVYKKPKLLVKATLATAARFNLDIPYLHVICYGEEIWGGQAKMIDYGHPCVIGDPPINTKTNLEEVEVPDPYSDGLYPGWLWTNRELRRIIDQYSLPIPLWTSVGPDPTGVAMMGMLGYMPFQKALIKNPEFLRRCCDIGVEWNIKLSRALIDVARPEGIYFCQFTGMFPVEGKEWLGTQLVEIAKNLKAYSPVPLHLSNAYSFLSGVFEWYETMLKGGSMTLDTFDGGTGGLSEDIDMKRVFDWHREHGIHLSYSIRDVTIEKGPASAIEEECKALCELAKLHPKFAPGVVPPYWAPPQHIDVAVAALKKYGKY